MLPTIDKIALNLTRDKIVSMGKLITPINFNGKSKNTQIAPLTIRINPAHM
jgi:hypothetical protein